MFWQIVFVLLGAYAGGYAGSLIETNNKILKVLGFIILSVLFYPLISYAIISNKAKKDYMTLSTPGYLRNQVIKTTHDLYGKEIRDAAGLLLGGIDVGRTVPIISTLVNEVDGFLYDENTGKPVMLKAVYGITPERKLGICVKNNSIGKWETDSLRTSIYNKYRKQYLENLSSFKRDGQKELKQGINPDREYELRERYEVPYAISLDNFVSYHKDRVAFRDKQGKEAFVLSDADPQLFNSLLSNLQNRMPKGRPTRYGVTSYGAYKYNIRKNKLNNNPSKKPFKTNNDGSFKNINEISISYNSIGNEAFDVITTKGVHYYVDVDMFGEGIKGILEKPMIIRDSTTRPRYRHVRIMIQGETYAYQALRYRPDELKSTIFGRDIVELIVLNKTHQQCDSVCRVIFNDIVEYYNNRTDNN